MTIDLSIMQNPLMEYYFFINSYKYRYRYDDLLLVSWLPAFRSSLSLSSFSCSFSTLDSSSSSLACSPD
jgi:hypothetical protein